MKVITRGQYEVIPKESKEGIFVFLKDGDCNICDEFLKNLSEYKDREFYKVLTIVLIISEEDIEWAMTKETITSAPATRIYLRGYPLKTFYGLMFPIQMIKLENYYLEYFK